MTDTKKLHRQDALEKEITQVRDEFMEYYRKSDDIRIEDKIGITRTTFLNFIKDMRKPQWKTVQIVKQFLKDQKGS